MLCILALSTQDVPRPDYAARKEIKSLIIYCSFQIPGCEWQGQLQSLEVSKLCMTSLILCVRYIVRIFLKIQLLLIQTLISTLLKQLSFDAIICNELLLLPHHRMKPKKEPSTCTVLYSNHRTRFRNLYVL